MRPKDVDRARTFRLPAHNIDIIERMVLQGISEVPDPKSRRVLARVGLQTGAFTLWSSKNKTVIERNKPLDIVGLTVKHIILRILD
jgi:hypothetical protein